MKRTASFLILCFLISCSVKAQGFIGKISVNASSPARATAISSARAAAISPARAAAISSAGAIDNVNPIVGFSTQLIPERHLTKPAEFTSDFQPQSVTHGHLQSSTSNNSVVNLEQRGFVKEKHLTSPSENSTVEIENTESLLRFDLDKLRIKVMMKQNRLNKAEMIPDKFNFYGLLIYHSEYGEYCITDYAA